MNRAYSLLEVKAVEEETRTIRGIATTPTPDRLGDIVDPLGVICAGDLPLLHHHDSHMPVGRVRFDKATKDGITFEARLPKVEEPASLKERIETAWGEVKAGLVRGVSIGFRKIAAEPINAKEPWGPQRFLKSEVLELSLVTVPANADATITQIKSIDVAQRIASGPRIVKLSQPGVTGANGRKQQEGSAMKTLAEQIASFEATRAAKAARQNDVMQKSMDEGRTTDAAEQEEFDTLQDEIKAIDADLTRLVALESTNKAAARPPVVQPGRAMVSDTQPARAAVQLKQNLPPATSFTRYVMAVARAKGNLMQAVEIAKQWQDSTPEVETVLRAAVTAGTTADADWAAPLVPYRQMADEFIALLRPATIVGRIPGLRQVPFMVKIPVQTQGSLVNWVGETLPKPVGELKFTQITLEFAKVAGIVVLSDELVRLSTPSAEAVVRQDMVAQVAQFIDVEFIDPANAAVASVSPASILNGVTGIATAGGSADELRLDIAALFNAFVGANLGLGDAVWITTESIALQISMMQNALGQPEFAGMGINGGTLFGRPVIASQSVPAGVFALVKASEILVADDGGVQIDVSREATLQMDSAPVAATAATFSLWQNNCVGIRAERYITWRRRRPEAVAWITGANYNGVVTP